MRYVSEVHVSGGKVQLVWSALVGCWMLESSSDWLEVEIVEDGGDLHCTALAMNSVDLDRGCRTYLIGMVCSTLRDGWWRACSRDVTLQRLRT